MPIINYAPQSPTGRRTEQAPKRAFASRDEARACAQQVIDQRRQRHERKLTTPRLRAYRDACGHPREITDCTVTDGERTGQVVKSANTVVPAGDGTAGVRARLLIEWPGSGQTWSDSTEVRLVSR
ncbi:hypothetical protein [Amycolatopsis sp. 195334CR]|uniref:hypothetical protein n=1 Tax=Amycolatopsis sp. 195334CR TaxID=2814588 RepID=UPI001A8F0778|nr:hypothetical protein [Amycolatopsis sp. 195334CR]MBN6040046.1 hypothetical protein [Amycolatopsis sp. 195334CR]